MSFQVFRFKRFEIVQQNSAMKVGTDGVLLGAWADIPQKGKVLDVGTGTGIIAIMSAQRSNSEITAVEIDKTAYLEAIANVNLCEWSHRINVVNDNFLDFVRKTSTKFDLIISNPPFFYNGMPSDDKERNIARHTFELSPVSLLKCSKKILSDNGSIAIITPYEQYDEIIYNATLYGYSLRKCTKVVSVQGKQPFRVMFQFANKPETETHSSLTIRNKTNDYTEDYKSLTKEFYLNF